MVTGLRSLTSSLLTIQLFLGTSMAAQVEGGSLKNDIDLIQQATQGGHPNNQPCTLVMTQDLDALFPGKYMYL